MYIRIQREFQRVLKNIGLLSVKVFALMTHIYEIIIVKVVVITWATVPSTNLSARTGQKIQHIGKRLDSLHRDSQCWTFQNMQHTSQLLNCVTIILCSNVENFKQHLQRVWINFVSFIMMRKKLNTRLLDK
jgi:hypothetical protein